MAKNKKQKENKPIIIDDLENLFGSDDMDLKCKHCSSSYVLKKGYDDKYCSKECFEADNDESLFSDKNKGGPFSWKIGVPVKGIYNIKLDKL